MYVIATHLLVQRLVVFKEALERLEHFDLTGDTGLRSGLSLHDSHSQRPLVPRDEALQVFQQQLQEVATVTVHQKVPQNNTSE
jgi:hypothetical protein